MVRKDPGNKIEGVILHLPWDFDKKPKIQSEGFKQTPGCTPSLRHSAKGFHWDKSKIYNGHFKWSSKQTLSFFFFQNIYLFLIFKLFYILNLIKKQLFENAKWFRFESIFKMQILIVNSIFFNLTKKSYQVNQIVQMFPFHKNVFFLIICHS